MLIEVTPLPAFVTVMPCGGGERCVALFAVESVGYPLEPSIATDPPGTVPTEVTLELRTILCAASGAEITLPSGSVYSAPKVSDV